MTIDFVIVVACETRKRHIEDPKRSFTNTFLYFLRWLVLVRCEIANVKFQPWCLGP